MRSWLTRAIYIPVSGCLKGESIARAFRELSRSQWSSQEELKAGQWSEVLRTLEQAEQIPFYQERWRALGVRAADLRTLQDFQTLPLLEKLQVRDHFDRLRKPQFGDALGQTSGSTGIPLRFAHGAMFRSRHMAGQWRARGWFGVQPGDAVLALWGRPMGSGRDRAVSGIKSFLNNIRLVSVFDFDRASIRRVLAGLPRWRPRLVYGYPSGIYALARQAEEDGVSLDGLGVGLVACTAEVLHDFQRALLERVFGSPVADVYGCAEFGSFAHQCPYGAMHLACENVFVEILDEGRPVPPGCPGEVVVTSLHNPGMPLLRYRVGDIACEGVEACGCGRGLPTLGLRAGKVGQMVRTPSGRLFSSVLFEHLGRQPLAEGGSGLSRFHVVQSRLDLFTVQYVAGPRGAVQALEAFERGMREVLGEGVTIAFEEVPEIPRHPGGKMALFTCQVPSES